MYADLTGKFLYQPSQGNQYMIVIHIYDTSTIDMEMVKSQITRDLKNAFVNITKKIIAQGYTPSTFILDKGI